MTVNFDAKFLKSLQKTIQDTLLLKADEPKKGAQKFWVQKALERYMTECASLDLNTKQDMKAEYLRWRHDKWYRKK